jgi:hypothetical protein
MPNYLTYKGINYLELTDGSGRMRSDGKAQRSLKCLWADRIKLLMLLRGFQVMSGGTYTVIPPALHPSGLPMYATDVGISPLGRPTGEDAWEYAKLDVQYTSATPSSDEGAVEVEDEDLDLSAEMVDLGKDGWSFGDTHDDANVKVDKPIQKIVPMLTYTVTQYHRATLPLAAMRGLLGKLNNAAWKGAPANYVMYCGGRAQRKTVALAGNTTVLDWTISHKFMVGNRDLLKEWKPSGTGAGSFQKIVSTNGTYKFELGDFSTLGIKTT